MITSHVRVRVSGFSSSSCCCSLHCTVMPTSERKKNSIDWKISPFFLHSLTHSIVCVLIYPAWTKDLFSPSSHFRFVGYEEDSIASTTRISIFSIICIVILNLTADWQTMRKVDRGKWKKRRQELRIRYMHAAVRRRLTPAAAWPRSSSAGPTPVSRRQAGIYWT